MDAARKRGRAFIGEFLREGVRSLGVCNLVFLGNARVEAETPQVETRPLAVEAALRYALYFLGEHTE
jgi:hypothetical protein